MKVGILLLDPNDKYVDNKGNLPSRPAFDSALLNHLCYNQRCVCSEATEAKLPKSLKLVSNIVGDELDYDVNLGIATMGSNPPHMLIVVRSYEELKDGKRFRLDNFTPSYIDKNIEIYFHTR